MAWTEVEQSIAAYLSEPLGPLASRSEPGPSGWVASVRVGGGQGADPGTVVFRRHRVFNECQMHAVAFKTVAGQPWTMVVRVAREPDGTWVVDPVGGGSGRGPHRPHPWVNFTARGGKGGADFAGGGDVIGDGADRAHAVRLCFADQTTVEDVVRDGVVLFYVGRPVRCPADVTISDSAGRVLNNYAEFSLLA